MIAITASHARYLGAIEREPLDTMLKEKDGYKYIPLSIIQAELRLIFVGMVKWEMVESTATKDGVYGWGKLSYKLPIDGSEEWIYQTGTAAIPITKKLRLTYPSLESHCILNAAKKIGPWFGQNLNRDQEEAELDPDTEIPVIDLSQERLLILIENASTMEELSAYKDMSGKNPVATVAYMKKLKTFIK